MPNFEQMIYNSVKCDARNHGEILNVNCKNARNLTSSIIQRRHGIEFQNN